MRTCGSARLFSLSAICLLFWFSLFGCGRSADRTVVKKAAPEFKASAEGSIKVVRQDLSMARDLKQPPVSEYVLGPEDRVGISVLEHDELRMEATVSATGQIAYYLVGDMQAAGLTPFQLRDEIEKKLADYIRHPEVVVRIIEYGSRKIYVLGRVKEPGVYRMRNDLTLLEAISMAGGITPEAYLGGAYLVRDGKILVVNFFELIEQGNLEENIPLAPGDVVYIPDRRDQKVFVLGEVHKQSAIPTTDRLTLFEAIAESGGFTRDANKKSVLVMRGNLSEPEIMEIDVRKMNPATNIPLQRGDIIYVASSSFADVERIAVRISHILDPFLKLGRGILLQDAAIDVLKGDAIKTSVIVAD